MMTFEIVEHFKKLPKTEKPILIEGLPGIGSVGKIAVDFMIDELEPTLLYTIYSNSFPNLVFISENNLVEMPAIKIHLHKKKGGDILLMSGDIQPVDERSSYEFAYQMVDLMKKLGCKEIVTLGGIGRPGPVKDPKVYITATDQKTLKKYESKKVNSKIGGVVSNIFGATGLLLGAAQVKGLQGAAFLVDTFGHPLHLGISEAKSLVDVLNGAFKLDIDLKKLDKDIKNSNAQMSAFKTSEKRKSLAMMKKQMSEFGSDTSYIG